MLIYLIGLPGVGKTTIGKRLSKQLQYDFIDLDEQIEDVSHKSIAAIFKESREDAFRALEKKELTHTFHQKNTVVACGGGTPCFFDNMDQMILHGRVIYLRDDLDLIADRLQADISKRPVLGKDAKEGLEKLMEVREKHYRKAHAEFSVSDNNFWEKINSFLTSQMGY